MTRMKSRALEYLYARLRICDGKVLPDTFNQTNKQINALGDYPEHDQHYKKLERTMIPSKDIEPLINEFTDLLSQHDDLYDQRTALSATRPEGYRTKSYQSYRRKWVELRERMAAKTRELDACLKKFADIEIVEPELPGNEEDVPILPMYNEKAFDEPL